MADEISTPVEHRVQEAATAFADFEAAIARFKAFDFRGLAKELFDAGKIGYLESRAEAAALEAMIAGFEAETFARHRALTIRAQELGVDLPPARDGGGGR